MRLFATFVAFQGAWFACVLGAARGMPAVGLWTVALVWGVQFALSPAKGQELILSAAAVALGLLWDTAMLRTGVVAYASPGPLQDWAPSWILALWILFSTLLREPLGWLHGRRALAAALGGLGGPLSYWSAVRLGAGRFDDLPQALLVLGLGWGGLTPLLTELAHRLAVRADEVARARAQPPSRPSSPL